MQDKLKVLIQDLVATQREDFNRRKSQLTRLWSKADRFEKLCSLREDWAQKRIESILREATRNEVTITKVKGNKVDALVQGMTLSGELNYETRGSRFRTNMWTRPRIALRLWFVGADNNNYTHEGKAKRHYGSGTGGEGICFIFGRKRLMTYNRLIEMMLNCMGK